MDEQTTPQTIPEARQAKIAELEAMRPEITVIRGRIAEIEDALADLQRQRAELEATANNLAGQIGVLGMLMLPTPDPEQPQE